MNIKAQAAFTTAKTGEQTKVVDGRTETVELRQVDGGLEITGEIVPNTPLEHEMVVAILDKKDEPACDVTYDIEPVTEKITFKIRFKHEKDVVEAAHARLKDRQEAENAGKPLHIHLEHKAAKAKAEAEEAAKAKKAGKAKTEAVAS